VARSGGTWALPGEPCRDTRVVLGAREAVHVEAGEGYAASARARDAVLEASVGRVAPQPEAVVACLELLEEASEGALSLGSEP